MTASHPSQQLILPHLDATSASVILGDNGRGWQVPCPPTNNHIATALGVQAVEHHHKRVRFFSTVELVNALASKWDPALRLPVGVVGLDVRAGLRRFAGMKKLYIDTLLKYLNETADVVDLLRRSIAVGDIQTASRDAHTLKGMSGMVEAREIYGLALSVEQMLNGGDVEAAMVLIMRHEAKLSPLRDDIQAALAVSLQIEGPENA
jgi:HPt (histidine-containing phosphotransfer) domain-containing protein